MKTFSKTSTTSGFAKDHADRLLRHLTAQIADAAKSAGADEVHDLRVAIRRFGAVLKTLDRCFPEPETTSIRLALKEVMGLAGNVRDRDIGVELLTKIGVPAEAPFVTQFETERVSAAEDLTNALAAWIRAGTSLRWKKVLTRGTKIENLCVGRIDDTAMQMLPPIAGKHFKRGEKAARVKTSPHELHRFRIATKKFRYTLDLFAPLYGDSVASLTDGLKNIQTLLGDINDYETVNRMISQVTPPDPPPDGAASLIAAGIVATIEKMQREKAEEFRVQWGQTFTAVNVRRWKKLLQHVASTDLPEAVKSGPVLHS